MIKKIITLSVIAFTNLCASPNHKLRHNILNASHPNPTQKSKSTSLIHTAKTFLGTRYSYGARSTKATDCSGFTQQVFKKHHKNIPRTSRLQSTIGKHIPKKDLRPGDLVFFSSKNTRFVTHVGIYLGNHKFIHASSGARKVTISSLEKKYYRNHYKGARRV